MFRTGFRVAAVPLALALAACGGGPRHLAEITPEVQDRLSGAWVLNPEESDDPQEALDAARAGEGQASRRPGGGMAPRGGGGGRGEMPGAGGRGGMPGGAGAMPPPQGGERGGNPQATRATLRLVTATPRRVDLTVSDSLVTVSYAARDVWMLPFGEKVERALEDDVTLESRAEWDEGRLVIRRSVSGGGSVTETYMPSMDGRRLTVAVESSLGGRGGLEFRRVYEAEGRD